MPLHVICPGCLKQFQVGERFAGMQGPCPSCRTIIPIPKESVKIQGNDDVESGWAGSKTEKKQRILARPLPRLDLEWDPARAKYYVIAVFGVLVLAFLVGAVPMYAAVRSLLAALGLCLVAFPLTLFGYQALRDREQIFAFTGKELYYRAGIVAAGYVILWLGFEYCLVATRADIFVSCLYLAAFAVLAVLLTHPLLLMKMPDALLHFCLFGFSVVLLRFLVGFGWFWESGGLIRYSTAPPPPLLPGM